MKKKILIYMDNDQLIRNYFSFNSLELPGYDIAIYANGNIFQKYIFSFMKNFKGYVSENKWREELHSILSYIMMTKYMKRSKAFKFRFMTRLGRKKRLIFKTLGMPVLSDMTIGIVKALLGENPEIRGILAKEKPDLVIIPSFITNYLNMDFVINCSKMSIKTLFLIDGWDNISSKTVFPFMPTYLAVWGQQSREHAIKIHRFPDKNIFLMGTPRFEQYMIKNNTDSSPYDFKYVLFTGCALPFDEISALKMLDYCLTVNNINDVKIIYRPHPWRCDRKSFDYFIAEDYQNVILDKQMAGYYYYTKIKPDFESKHLQPSLDYYVPLIKNALFTISPLTTMIIEAALLDKYVLVTAYDDGVHYMNPKNCLKNYEHFIGIEKISAFKFCYDFNDLADRFMSLLNEVERNKTSRSFKDELKYFIEISEERYSKRLGRVLEEIFKREGDL